MTKKLSWCFMALLVLATTISLTSCNDDDEDDKPDLTDIAIRGYWICDSENLALEIISKEEYFKLKGESQINGSYPDNVYQLWYTGVTQPQCWVSWTSQIGNSFYFNNLNYTWKDEVSVASCSDDDLYLDGVDFYHFRRVTKQEFENILKRQGNNPNPGDNTDIASIIRNNSSCTATYSDYHVNINIEHTILSKLPNAAISYEIGHAERGSDECTIISHNREPITPDVSIIGNTTSVKIQYPFYYYFIALWGNAKNYSDEQHYAEVVTKCEMYLASYMALKNKSSLSEEEQNLLYELTKYLNKYQSEVRGSYTVWVYININYNNYLLKSFNI